MNRTLFFCIGLVAVLPIWSLHAKPTPKLECLEPVYEFGTVDGAKPVSHTFQIRNAGDAELLIRKIHAPCGCTSFLLSNKTLIYLSAFFKFRITDYSYFIAAQG